MTQLYRQITMPVSFMLYDDPPSALQERDPNISATKDANSVPNGAIYKLPWGTGLDDLRNGEDLDKLSKQRISKTGIQKASKASREERNLEGWRKERNIAATQGLYQNDAGQSLNQTVFG